MLRKDLNKIYKQKIKQLSRTCNTRTSTPQVKILYSIRIYAIYVHIKDYFLWLEKMRYFKMICKICKPRYNNRKLLRLKDKSNLKMFRYLSEMGLNPSEFY